MSSQEPGVSDPATKLRRALRRFPTGVTVVTVLDEDGRLAGSTANSFTSVSLEPPLVLVCLGLASRTYERCVRRRGFAVNILAGSQIDTARAFATRGGDRSGVCPWRAGSLGHPLLPGSLAVLECTLVNNVRAGDHAILIGEVGAIAVEPEPAEPLVFHEGELLRLSPR